MFVSFAPELVSGGACFGDVCCFPHPTLWGAVWVFGNVAVDCGRPAGSPVRVV